MILFMNFAFWNVMWKKKWNLLPLDEHDKNEYTRIHFHFEIAAVFYFIGGKTKPHSIHLPLFGIWNNPSSELYFFFIPKIRGFFTLYFNYFNQEMFPWLISLNICQHLFFFVHHIFTQEISIVELNWNSFRMNNSKHIN